MLVATFGSTTGWVGKTITHENGTFTLQDHGPITAAAVMEYDRQGHLLWPNEGTRAWVGGLARMGQSSPVGEAVESRTTREGKSKGKRHRRQHGGDSDFEALMAQMDRDFAAAKEWYESEHRDPLVLADFNSRSGMAGRVIVIDEYDRFILDGHGPVTAGQILEWDRRGFLTWLSPESRELVRLQFESDSGR
jgi:hypothetical protein